ncbi:hypothetical protein MesoLj113a_28640 [Mesorhizobium sp. 113-1-2]|jgi:hypothetical protein|nr:hypothetical protein MesoLj113a_28640 [Mesorhizobium sp. 113-1-2]
MDEGSIGRNCTHRKGHVSPPDDRKAQLARVLSSADFQATDRERRFLVYETLAGRSDRIKAYSIAVEAFDWPFVLPGPP